MDAKKIFWAWLNSGANYSAEAQAVFANMPDALTTPVKNAIAAFVDSQVLSGNWSLLIDFVYGGLNTQANSLKGFKGVITGSLHGSAYWTPYSNIYTEGAANSYIGTGIIPNNIADFGLNDAAIGFWLNYNPFTAGSKAGVGVLEADATTQTLLSQSGTGGTTLTLRLNTTNGFTYTDANGSFDNNTMYDLVRTSSVASALYVNGVSVASSGAVTSGAKATIEIYLGARNSSGTAGLLADASYKCYFIHKAVGFNHTSFYNAVVALNAAIDVIAPIVPAFFNKGQSNSSGQGELNRQLGLTTYVANQIGARIYYKATRDTTDNGNWRKMILGVNNGDIAEEATSNVFGIEGALGTILYENKNISLNLIKSAKGGSSLTPVVGTYNDWDPSSGPTDLFETSRDGYDLPALAKLKLEYPNRTVKSVLMWHQGEANTVAEISANFAAFVTAWRATSPDFATAPLIITKLYYNLDANEADINTFYDTYAASVPNVYVINPAASVTYAARKVDLSAGIKATYPPTLTDNNHNSFDFQNWKAVLTYNKLVEIGYI